MRLQWVAALLTSSNLQLPAILWFLHRPTYRSCHNAEGCEETDIKRRGARHEALPRNRIPPKNQWRGNIGILLLWQQSGRLIGGLINAIGREIENCSQKS